MKGYDMMKKTTPQWIIDKKNVSCVYTARLKGTNRYYVGSSADFYNKYINHSSRAFNPNMAKYNAKNKFYVAVREYGWDAFQWNIYPTPKDKLKEVENEIIRRLFAVSIGFNSMDAYRKWTDNMKKRLKGKRGNYTPREHTAKDTICPRCNVNKVGEYKCGRARKNCSQCNRQRGAKNKGRADLLCPRCNVNKCGVYTTGKSIGAPRNHCTQCNMKRGKSAKK